MKTILITLAKDGAQAACTMRYHFDSAPESTTWAGNPQAFALRDGSPFNPAFPIARLQVVIAHQATQAAATFTIEDLGGDAIRWMDDLTP